MPWLDLCILIAAVYLAILVGRGLIDFGNWLIEIFIRGPRERARLERKARKRRLQTADDDSQKPDPSAA